MSFDLDRSSGAWFVAGVPLVVTFFQTVFALLDWTTESAGIATLLEPVLAIDVVFEAAEVFKDRPALVVSLFILITGAWAAQGTATFVKQHRDAAFAAAGLAGVLYLVLFFGVYSPLFGQGLPTGQLVGFFLIPILATGLVVASALTYDWSEEVLDEVAGEVGTLESTLSERRSTFETEYDARIGDLSGIEPIAPTGVERAREQRAAFVDDCDSIAEALDDLREVRDPDAARATINELSGRVESLDPEETVDRIADGLRTRLVSGIRTEFGSVQFRSRFGERYRTSNLPAQHRELVVSPWNETVRLNQLGEALARRAEEGASIGDLSTAVTAALDHVERAEQFVEEHEAETESNLERIETCCTTVIEQVERLDGDYGARVTELLVENRHERLLGVRGIERERDEALEEFHDCRFSESDRRLSAAAEEAQTLVTTAEFVRSIVGRLEYESSTVSIPDEVPVAVVRELLAAIEREFDVDAEVRGTELQITYGDSDRDRRHGTTAETGGGNGNERTEAVTEVREPSEPSTTTERPEDVLDEVLFVLRELEGAARAASETSVQYQTADLPPSVGRPAVLANVERFLGNQSDLIRDVELQRDAPPGFLEVVVADEIQPARAIQTARERYTQQYG